MYSDLVRHVSCIVCTTYDVHVVMLSFHCRPPTLHKCGPCPSGGEPSGVCCQRQLHVLCVCESLCMYAHTCEQNVLTVSDMVRVTGLVQV